jgi:hypothetical protein
MLRELLALIASGGFASKAEAARKFGIGEAAIEDMIARLVTLGYLENVSETLARSSCTGGCAGGQGCAGCPMAGGCAKGFFRASQGTVFMMTVKGMRIVESGGAAAF